MTELRRKLSEAEAGAAAAQAGQARLLQRCEAAESAAEEARRAAKAAKEEAAAGTQGFEVTAPDVHLNLRLVSFRMTHRGMTPRGQGRQRVGDCCSAGL